MKPFLQIGDRILAVNLITYIHVGQGATGERRLTIMTTDGQGTPSLFGEEAEIFLAWLARNDLVEIVGTIEAESPVDLSDAGSGRETQAQLLARLEAEVL